LSCCNPLCHLPILPRNRASLLAHHFLYRSYDVRLLVDHLGKDSHCSICVSGKFRATCESDAWPASREEKSLLVVRSSPICNNLEKLVGNMHIM
jgi:hypothetical protein